MKPRALITCKVCRRQFNVWPYRLKRKDGQVKCCSKQCYWKSKIGTKIPEDVRKKMSLSHGKPMWLVGAVPWNKGRAGLQVAWNKGKICEKWRGKGHWNWQGGKTTESRRIRKSTEYKIWRLSVLERDKFTCVFCGKRGGNLHADHIKPFCKFPELRLEKDNGRTLCVDCHKKTDTYLRKAINYV